MKVSFALPGMSEKESLVERLWKLSSGSLPRIGPGMPKFWKNRGGPGTGKSLFSPSWVKNVRRLIRLTSLNLTAKNVSSQLLRTSRNGKVWKSNYAKLRRWKQSVSFPGESQIGR